MSGETTITVTGNITADPELRYTQGGDAVVSFTVASTERQFDRQSNEWKDGNKLFLRCSAWRDFAENIAGELRKGMPVIVRGNLVQRSYQDRDGNNRTSFELKVLDVGRGIARSGQRQQERGYQANTQQANGYDSDTPF